MADPRRIAPLQRVSPAGRVENPLYEVTDIAAYAQDLVEFASKHKFLFIVKFNFNVNYNFLNENNRLSLLVNESTRPSPKFDYEEVNLYGARTYVPKRTIFSPMSLKFFDDQQNEVMRFFVNTLRAMSPITNIHDPSELEYGQYDFKMGEGYNFDDGGFPRATPTRPHSYAVSIGPLSRSPGNESNPVPPSVLHTIELFHVYRYGDLCNHYTFQAPRITDFKLDDLTMNDSERTMIGVDFTYTSFDVQMGQPFTPEIAQLVGQVIFPLKRDG